MIRQCIILAGGLGTRVKEVAGGRPKALLHVGGKPFLEWQLTWLASQGICSVTLCIGHLGGDIRRFVSTGEKWGIEVGYVEETGGLLGTGGALRNAVAAGSIDESVGVMYGDSLLQTTVRAVGRYFSDETLDGVMTVLKNRDEWDRSNVSVEGRRIVRYTKDGVCRSGLEFIDYGLTILRRSAIVEGLPPGRRVDLGVLYRKMAAKGELGAYEVSDRFFEIGSPAGLSELDALLRSGWRPGRQST